MQNNAENTPRARREGLVVVELPDEVLVYDSERDKALCLNQTAALVWKYCDGRTTMASMVRQMKRDLNTNRVDEKIVTHALDQLSRDHLLENGFVLPALPGGMTRRQMVRALGVAAVVAIPVVTSIVAPTPAQAVSCVAPNDPCVSSAQCCTGLCNPTSGVCEPGPPVERAP